jgi:hypothetical protein
MCVPTDDCKVQPSSSSSSELPNTNKPMERALVIRKDLVVPDKLKYLCTWGGPISCLDGYHDRLREYANKMAYVTGQRYGSVEVAYEEKSGRLFGQGLCFQSMPRKVRNFIIDDRLIDIDIKNSAPTIIQQVCKLHSIDTPQLDYFNANYSRLLRSLNVNDTKKTKAVIFFGSVASKHDDVLDFDADSEIGVNPGWLNSLKMELDETVYPKLKEIEKYQGLENEAICRDRQKRLDHEDAKRRRRNVRGDYVSNVRGIFLSLLYFMEETSLVKTIDEVGRYHNLWDNRVGMMFDGLLVFPKSGGVLTLADLENVARLAHQRTGIRVYLDFKDTTDKLQLDITKIPSERVVLKHHREAADMMLYLLKNKVCRDVQTPFAKRDGVWTSDRESVQSLILNETSKSDIKLKDFNKLSGQWETVNFSCKTDHALKIAKLVTSDLPVWPGFGRELVLNSAMKILFRNGYYEFLEEQYNDTGIYGRFVYGKSFDSGVMVPWDFPIERNQADIDFVKQKYFDDPFDNTEAGLEDNFLRALGRAMAGTSEKITNLVTGPRNCGKSVTFQLMKYCFGGYVTSINAGSFQVSKGFAESSRDMSWALQCENARVVFISETVATDKSGISELCGNRLKIFQSMKEGALSARLLYSNERNVVSLGKGFLLCNDPPNFKPHDAYKMVHPYALPNKFVSRQELDANHHQPTYKLADPMIELWYKEERYRDALIYLILESFSPFEVIPTEGMMEDLDVMEEEIASSVYEDKFIYTGNLSDRVEQKVVKAIVNEHIPEAKHKSISNEFLVRIRNVKPDFDDKKLNQKSHDKKYYRGVKVRTMAGELPQVRNGGGGASDSGGGRGEEEGRYVTRHIGQEVYEGEYVSGSSHSEGFHP